MSTLWGAYCVYRENHVRRNAPKNTLITIGTVERSVFRFFPKAKTWIEDLDRSALTRYFDHLQGPPRNLGPSSIALHFRIIGAILNTAADMEERSRINKRVLFPPAVQQIRYVPKKRFLSSGEVKLLLDHSRDDRDREYWLGYLYTGCRRSELFDLQTHHVNLEAMSLFIPGTKSASSAAFIPVAPPLVPVLGSRLKEAQETGTTFLFPKRKHFDQVLQSTIRRIREAGIPFQDTTLHDLRRSTGSLLVQANVSINIVSAILRHSNIETTYRTYAVLNSESKATAIGKIPDFSLAS